MVSLLSGLCVLLCCIGASAARQMSFLDYDTVDCDVTAMKPSYVDAIRERYAHAAGCVSNETAPSGRHVHVVFMTSPEAPENDVVTLSISPEESVGDYNGRLAFVLISKHPVLWQIRAENVSDRSKTLFWLSKDSRLAKNSAMNVRVKKYDFPTTREGIFQWVRNELGAVTSYLEVASAVKIMKKLGSESSAPEKCILADNFYAPSTAALYLNQQQQIDGCVARWNEGFNNKDTHVIEVHSVYSALTSSSQLSSSGSPLPVSIVIRAKPLRTPPRKDLVLVLKSHVPVEWLLSTVNIKGELKIITDQSVDTQNINMHEMQYIHEDLSGQSGVPLVIWAANHGYGPAVSYSDVDAVNQLVLTVDGGDDLPKHRPIQRSSMTSSDEVLHGSVAHILHKAKEVSCGLHSITATLKKADLVVDGLNDIDLRQLSLSDLGCRATENATHFILQTGLEGCSMVVHQSGASHFYQNEIVLNLADPSMQSDASDFSEGSASGIPMDDTYVDDEDMSSSGLIRVSFQCEYINTRYNAWEHSLDDIDIQLSVYRDANFQQQYATFHESPVRVPEDATLYVEVSLPHADPDLQPMIRDCLVIPAVSNNGEDETAQEALITKGCKGTSAEWLGGNTHQVVTGPQRFKFTYKKYWEGVYVTHLQCNIALCSHSKETARAYGIPTCVPVHQYCVYENMDGKGDEAWYRTLLRGPFMRLTSRDYKQVTVDKKGEPVAVGCAEVRSPTEGCMKVEGLDSGTVIGIALAAFVIGVLLMAALWYIHSHTGVRRTPLNTYIEGPMLKRGLRSRSAETSGESTPSSTAPIAIHHVHH